MSLCVRCFSQQSSYCDGLWPCENPDEAKRNDSEVEALRVASVNAKRKASHDKHIAQIVPTAVERGLASEKASQSAESAYQAALAKASVAQ